MNATLINFLLHSRHRLRVLLISCVLARSLLILLAILSVVRAITTHMEYITEDTEVADANNLLKK